MRTTTPTLSENSLLGYTYDPTDQDYAWRYVDAEGRVTLSPGVTDLTEAYELRNADDGLTVPFSDSRADRWNASVPDVLNSGGFAPYVEMTVKSFPVVTGCIFRKHTERGLATVCYRCDRTVFLNEFGLPGVTDEAGWLIDAMVHFYTHRSYASQKSRSFEANDSETDTESYAY